MRRIRISWPIIYPPKSIGFRMKGNNPFYIAFLISVNSIKQRHISFNMNPFRKKIGIHRSKGIIRNNKLDIKAVGFIRQQCLPIHMINPTTSFNGISFT